MSLSQWDFTGFISFHFLRLKCFICSFYFSKISSFTRRLISFSSTSEISTGDSGTNNNNTRIVYILNHWEVFLLDQQRCVQFFPHRSQIDLLNLNSHFAIGVRQYLHGFERDARKLEISTIACNTNLGDINGGASGELRERLVISWWKSGKRITRYAPL